jgi:aspartyl-tRNA(Asn)/glutamyl-tRNA(Gln) amidotransferase subunit C
MDREKVLDLAKLARIEISDKEADELSNEFSSILNYVGEVKKVTAETRELETPKPIVRNVFRKDEESHQSGIYTKKIIDQAPKKENNYIKVKNII